MKDHKLKTTRIAIHIYMAASVCALLLLLPCPIIGYIFFSVGASSSIYSALLALSSSTPAWLSIILLIWSVGFTLCLIVFYFVSIKSTTKPFLVMVALDAASVILTCVVMLFGGNAEGVLLLLVDAVASVFIGMLALSSVFTHYSG